MQRQPSVFLLMFIVFAVSWLGSCDPDLADTTEDDPGYFEATDGDLPGSIFVDWGVVDETRSDEVVGYEVWRSPWDKVSYEFIEETLDTCYEDTSVIQGVLYYYYVVEQYADSTDASSFDDSGFAMDATILPIGSAERQFPVHDLAGPGEAEWVWYEIMAQEGWTYTVETYVAETATADTALYIYPEGEVVDFDEYNDNIVDGTNLFSSITFTCTDSGKYYVNVVAGDPDTTYNISMWHHD